MKWGVVRFPGSLDDGDAMHALADVMGQDARILWHKDESLQGALCVVLPGGFSYGDTNVGLIVSNPAFRSSVLKTLVSTAQVAPSILHALGVSPTALKSVQIEKTEVLPALP